MLLNLVLIVFIILESMNVIILYHHPCSKKGNGVAVFKDFCEAQGSQKSFVTYMANWVAGTKLIFIVLLVVILVTSGETTKIWSILVMLPAIGTYYLKLHPIIKALDQADRIDPKGYSKTLGWMIGIFLAVFTLALIGHLFL